ncbi:MAG: hypothetical protein H7210_13620 [Pyrinomonadaceae bacterium]|nr:hypothetical protein [Phycisphaerales bacterium]
MTRHAQSAADAKNSLAFQAGESNLDRGAVQECSSCCAAQSNPACVPALVAAALIAQAVRVVESVSDESYCRTSSRLKGGTIGKHFRHCLDHFAAALVPANDMTAMIDYDRRERNVPMETCRTTAAGALRTVIEQLRVVDAARGSLSVRVRVMLTGDGQEIELTSTLARELAFAAHHAVHHHAMIKAIAEEFGEAVPGEFGKAPSTIHFERATNPA